MNVRIFIISLVVLYAVNIVVKWSYYSCRIRRGKQLKRLLYNASDNSSALYQLLAGMKSYCKKADITLLPKPYNGNVELLNRQVQSVMFKSIDKAIGVYQERRRYCYILFVVDNDGKRFTLLKLLLDVLVKAIPASVTAIVTEVIKGMLF